MPILPFGSVPGHWGLKGKTREIAKAEYELEGEALERKLVEINFSDEKDVQKELAKLDLKHNRITKYEYDRILIEIGIDDEKERDIQYLYIERKYNNI